MAHGLVSRRRGPQLGAVEGHPAEPDQSGLCAQGEHLDEQGVDGDQVTAPEARDGAVVGGGVAPQPAEGHVDVAPPLHLPGAGDPGRVGEEQELEHHRRVIGRSARGLDVGVVDAERSSMVVDHLGDEAGLVVLGQPVVERGRQQERLGLVVVAEALVAPAGTSRAGTGPVSTSKSLSPTRSSAMGKFSQTRRRIANHPPPREGRISPLGSSAGSDPPSGSFAERVRGTTTRALPLAGPLGLQGDRSRAHLLWCFNRYRPDCSHPDRPAPAGQMRSLTR